jgi:hypothetical protein
MVRIEASAELISMPQSDKVSCPFHANFGKFSIVILNMFDLASHLLYSKTI